MAAVAAAGGATALLRSGGSSSPSAPAATNTPIRPLAPTAAASPAGFAQKQGGIATITSPSSFNFDTFDAQLTGSSSVVEILGRTHSRLLNWDGRDDTHLVPDLAARWEQPDAVTYLFHLDLSAKWQPRPPLNGRAVTADDVVQHFRRSLELAPSGKAPLAQRYHDYAAVESVDSPAAGRVRFRLKQPDPFFFGTLAGEYALIQAPEAVSSFAGQWSKRDSDHVIGSGPWLFDWADNGARFTAFREGHRKPFLDELRVWEPRDNVARFLNSEVHEVITRDRREAETIRAQTKSELLDKAGSVTGEAQPPSDKTNEFRRYEREIVMSSFFVGAPPWNNPQLVALISAALNRYELARRLFGERARPVPVVPPAFSPASGLGISSEHLKFLPGFARLEGPYAPDPELSQRWKTAGGSGMGTITVDFPSVFDPLYSASSVVIDMFNLALGPQFRPAVETYTTISKRVLDGYYGNGRAAFWFGWGPPAASPDLSGYLADTYAAGSPGQRVTGGKGASIRSQDDLLGVIDAGFLGIVPWVQQYAEVFRRPGHIAQYPNPFWPQHLDYQRSNV